MKKFRGFSVLFIIPIIALLLSVGGVFAYKLYSEATKAKASEVPIDKIVPPLVTETGKPVSGYGGIQGPTPGPTGIGGKTGSSSGQINIETLFTEDPNDSGPDFSIIDTSLTQL